MPKVKNPAASLHEKSVDELKFSLDTVLKTSVRKTVSAARYLDVLKEKGDVENYGECICLIKCGDKAIVGGQGELFEAFIANKDISQSFPTADTFKSVFNPDYEHSKLQILRFDQCFKKLPKDARADIAFKPGVDTIFKVTRGRRGSYKKKGEQNLTNDDLVTVQTQDQVHVLNNISLENAGADNVAQVFFDPVKKSRKINKPTSTQSRPPSSAFNILSGGTLHANEYVGSQGQEVNQMAPPEVNVTAAPANLLNMTDGNELMCKRKRSSTNIGFGKQDPQEPPKKKTNSDQDKGGILPSNASSSKTYLPLKKRSVDKPVSIEEGQSETEDNRSTSETDETSREEPWNTTASQEDGLHLDPNQSVLKSNPSLYASSSQNSTSVDFYDTPIEEYFSSKDKHNDSSIFWDETMNNFVSDSLFH